MALVPHAGAAYNDWVVRLASFVDAFHETDDTDLSLWAHPTRWLHRYWLARRLASVEFTLATSLAFASDRIVHYDSPWAGSPSSSSLELEHMHSFQRWGLLQARRRSLVRTATVSSDLEAGVGDSSSDSDDWEFGSWMNILDEAGRHHGWVRIPRQNRTRSVRVFSIGFDETNQFLYSERPARARLHSRSSSASDHSSHDSMPFIDFDGGTTHPPT